MTPEIEARVSAQRASRFAASQLADAKDRRDGIALYLLPSVISAGHLCSINGVMDSHRAITAAFALAEEVIAFTDARSEAVDCEGTAQESRLLAENEVLRKALVLITRMSNTDADFRVLAKQHAAAALA